jgi:hypothetical protein
MSYRFSDHDESCEEAFPNERHNIGDDPLIANRWSAASLLKSWQKLRSSAKDSRLDDLSVGQLIPTSLYDSAMKITFPSRIHISTTTAPGQ